MATTPNQSAPDGAYVIGGDRTGEIAGKNWGQDWTEEAIRQLFAVPAPTFETAIDLLGEALSRLPLEALKQFAPLIPYAVEDDFLDVATAVSAIMGSLTDTILYLKKDIWDGFLNAIGGGPGTTVEFAVDKLLDALSKLESLVETLLLVLGIDSEGTLLDKIFDLADGFDDWLTDFDGLLGDFDDLLGDFGDLGTVVDQIANIFAGNAVSPVNSLVEAIQDWWGGIQDKTSSLDSLGRLPASKIIGQLAQDSIDGLEDALENLGDGLQAALENVLGIIDPRRLPLIPVSHIGDTAANLLPNGDIDGAVSIDGNGEWEFDPDEYQSAAGRSTPGSARTTADGTEKELLSEDLIYVTEGQTISITGYVKYEDLTATGDPIELGLQTYSDLSGSTPVSRPTLAAPDGPSGDSGWTLVQGTWTVPAGIKTVRARMTVKATATAGSVWFDRVNPSKTGLLALELVKDLPSLLQFLDLDGLFDASKLKNIPGIPTLPGEKVTGIAGNIVEDLTEHLGNVVDRLLGGAGSTLEDASEALKSLKDTILGLSRDVQDLQRQQAGANTSGKTYVVKYETYPDGELSAVGVPFDLTYTGTGSGYQKVQGGQSSWHKVADGDRHLIGRYDGPDGSETDTDYQWIQATAAGAMDQGAENAFCARLNEDKDTYVYVKVYRTGIFGLGFKCELGCYVDGVKHVFVTDRNVTFSFNLALKAGVGGDPYRFQFISGNTIIIDYTDAAHISQVGEDYRGWGFTATTANGGNAIPATGTYFQCSDNAPVDVVGTTMRVYRSSTSTVTPPTGDVPLPAGTFDVVQYKSSDLDWNPTTNEITVHKSGTYLCTMRLEYNATAGMGATDWHSIWYVNGVTKHIGKPTKSVGPNGVGIPALSLDSGIGGDPFVYYLLEGDVIRVGMGSNGPTPIKGDTEGKYTNLTVTKIT